MEMRYIYNQDGRIAFFKRGSFVYDREGRLLDELRITDEDVYSGTEYMGYVAQDVFHPSENFKKKPENSNQKIEG